MEINLYAPFELFSHVHEAKIGHVEILVGGQLMLKLPKRVPRAAEPRAKVKIG